MYDTTREGQLLKSRLCCPKSFQQCKRLGQRRQKVWKMSKIIHLCQTGTTATGGGLRHYLLLLSSPTSNAMLSSLLRQLNNHATELPCRRLQLRLKFNICKCERTWYCSGDLGINFQLCLCWQKVCVLNETSWLVHLAFWIQRHVF